MGSDGKRFGGARSADESTPWQAGRRDVRGGQHGPIRGGRERQCAPGVRSELQARTGVPAGRRHQRIFEVRVCVCARAKRGDAELEATMAHLPRVAVADHDHQQRLQWRPGRLLSEPTMQTALGIFINPSRFIKKLKPSRFIEKR